MRALVPLLAAGLAVPAIPIAGLTQRSLLGTPFEDQFYGFFLDRYPLFLFAIVYGTFRIIASAILDPGRWRGLRVVAAPLALGLFLAACLHPTFGGLVLRAGFFTGGMAFLTGQTMAVAYALGAGAGAAVYGLALGTAIGIARLFAGGGRISWRLLRVISAVFLALWWGGLVLGAPRALGLDPTAGWPGLPLSATAALVTAGLVVLAFLPHALVTQVCVTDALAVRDGTSATGSG